MTVEPIGTAAAAVYITPAELREWGLTPETITAEAAAELARKALARVGMQAEGRIEIEAYHDPLGVLLFARVRAEEQWFSFPGWEELLQGVQSLPRPRPDGLLGEWDGRYWLKLRGGGRGICRLTEFGQTETPSPCFEARLEEGGSVILPTGAVEVLERHFRV